MQTIRTIAELRAALQPARAAGQTIGLVPTMGALHAGHRMLVEAARAECDIVVTSLFVNPTQFGPNEDFARYPRAFNADQALLREAGCDFLFAPEVDELYAGEGRIWVTPDPAVGDNILCGASRPGHFRGVLTVVQKLFNIAQPSHAYFGQKDFQQAWLIQRLVRELDSPIAVRVMPTVREHDGLAMSSRNQYLSEIERTQATVLSRALGAGRHAILQGAADPDAVEAQMRKTLATVPAFVVEYAEVRDARTLAAAQAPLAEELILLVAGRLGTTRLIDNELVQVPARSLSSDVMEGVAHVS